MFVWIRDKGIAQSDSGKGGAPWTGGAIGGKLPKYRHTRMTMKKLVALSSVEAYSIKHGKQSCRLPAAVPA